MFVLTVIPTGSYEIPAVTLDVFDNVSDFHNNTCSPSDGIVKVPKFQSSTVSGVEWSESAAA